MNTDMLPNAEASQSAAFSTADAYGEISSVIIHNTIIASGTDLSMTTCARRVAEMALDALEGDLTFMSENCDCREVNAARKAAKKALKAKEADENQMSIANST